MQSISFDEGYKEFAINNDENRVIRFNPKDFGILTRMEDTLSDFEALEKKLKDGNEEEFTNNLREAEKVVHEKIDSIFNANVHEIIFNHQSPISLGGGEVFVMRVIDALLPIVEKEVKYEMQKSEKRMSKYTEKYKKW